MFAFGPLPPLMFGGMICFLLLGFPVAFSLATVGLIFGAFGIATNHFSPDFLQALPFRFFGIISNELLLAIPFFTFMGAVLGGAAWPRTSSKARASSSARSRAASPTR